MGTTRFFDPDDKHFVKLLRQLATGNPFLPERIDYERQALGDDFVTPRTSVWSKQVRVDRYSPNVARLAEKAEALVGTLRQRLTQGARPKTSSTATENELSLYEDLVLYHLYYQFEESFEKAMNGRVSFYDEFCESARGYLSSPGLSAPLLDELPHAFSFLFQVRRASHHIFNSIVGGSMPAAKLRARVWESIFTYDMDRYRRHLYEKMGDVSTLITGPSGTGKEIVARCIALCRYVPFSVAKKKFSVNLDTSFYALNLSALAPTLIESELFGHQRGAFTGALQDRKGWLEVCPALGSVFLDEIGELDSGIQVKLLRVLQSREFQRLGDTSTHQFSGKIIAATNRDLATEIESGRFREDFYYRLCSDLITTPSLADQLRDTPEDLGNFVLFLVRRMMGPAESESVTSDVIDWIDNHLRDDYPWPGNVRELEQCVRNVILRRQYEPLRRPSAKASLAEDLAERMERSTISVDELVEHYCTLTYLKTDSYMETSRRLGLDRRTVKARVNQELLEQLKKG